MKGTMNAAAAAAGGQGSRSLWIEPSSARIIRDKNTGINSGYGFIEFDTHEAAQHCLTTYNGTMIPGTSKRFRLNWGVQGGGSKAVATSKEPSMILPGTPEYSVYVGDLDPRVTETDLLELFQGRYRSVLNAKIILDPSTKLNKGYGFVKFSNIEDADRAIQELNGFFFKGKPMKVNYSTLRTPNEVASLVATLYSQQGNLPVQAQTFYSQTPGSIGGNMTQNPMTAMTPGMFQSPMDSYLSAMQNMQSMYGAHGMNPMQYYQYPQAGGATPMMSMPTTQTQPQVMTQQTQAATQQASALNPQQIYQQHLQQYNQYLAQYGQQAATTYWNQAMYGAQTQPQQTGYPPVATQSYYPNTGYLTDPAQYQAMMMAGGYMMPTHQAAQVTATNGQAHGTAPGYQVNGQPSIQAAPKMEIEKAGNLNVQASLLADQKPASNGKIEEEKDDFQVETDDSFIKSTTFWKVKEAKREARNHFMEIE